MWNTQSDSYCAGTNVRIGVNEPDGLIRSAVAVTNPYFALVDLISSVPCKPLVSGANEFKVRISAPKDGSVLVTVRRTRFDMSVNFSVIVVVTVSLFTR